MAEGDRPELQRSSCLRGAGGSPIRERGMAQFKLKLGPLEIVREAIVAEIEDDALLGYDALYGGPSGPADILLSRNVIVMDGHEVPCIKRGCTQRTRKVTVAEDVKIPGNTELLIGINIEGLGNDAAAYAADYAVKPVEKFQDTYQLIMSPTPVYNSPAATTRVHVTNPIDDILYLKRDTEIGRAEKIERIVSVFATVEDSDDRENLNRVRRVGTGSRRVNELNACIIKGAQACHSNPAVDTKECMHRRRNTGATDTLYNCSGYNVGDAARRSAKGNSSSVHIQDVHISPCTPHVTSKPRWKRNRRKVSLIKVVD